MVELSNLPVHRPSLIGREEDVFAIRQRLREIETGLLTLTGAGGCGKSRLAVEVAYGERDQYPDGVWLVELAPLSEPSLVDNAVAAVLGVRERPGQSLRDCLLAFLQPKVLLLVLDNCEHLVEICAYLADALLRTCPGLRILATSREPLHTSTEVTWRVPSLAAPDGQRNLTVDELLAYPAVQLFVTRAQAVRPDFSLGPETATWIARVCARLEGMPLALELAAACTRVLGISQIAARLDEDFRILVGGSRTAHSRQQTLEATLDWSHRLLTDDEPVLFRRLSVFAGGFDLDAAEQVCTGDTIKVTEVLDVLTRLVDKSLVVAEERAGHVRHRMLEPIRQYAWQRLTEAGEDMPARQQHAAYFRALAERVEPELWGPDQATWLVRLERDHSNLRAALSWCHASSEDAEAERRFAVALSRFWHTRGELGEGRIWLQRALEAPACGATRGLATALTWEAALAHSQGDFDEAVAFGERAVAASRELGEPLILAMALLTLGDNLIRPGGEDRAIAVIEEGLEIVRGIGDRAGPSLVVGLGLLGSALRMRGDVDRATDVLEDGVTLNRAVGNKWALGICLQDLAQVERERGHAQRAVALFSECMAVAQDIRDSRRVAECLEGFAELAAESGIYEPAARLLGAAHVVRETNGSMVEPVDRPIYDSCVSATRSALGEAGFAAAWASGQAAPLERIIDEALVGSASEPIRPTTGSPPSTPLSAREWEVVRLVARGLSNPQIAEQLVISRRTVDRHISNILNKLGFTTRGQVAAWIFRHGISPTNN
jgi:predicted ATPase/DNA-binding CsgD family transcriptional regulator